jgi:hypothetical protein
MGDGETNWVDPDILEYNGGVADPANRENEERFKQFFEVEWLEPKYDHLRERWDKHLNDPEPIGRLFGKTALWSYIQLIETQKAAKQDKLSMRIVEYLNTPKERGGPGPADEDEMTHIFPRKREAG